VARAFITPAPIILLDEPTNAMDSTNEMRFLNAIKKHKHGKTTIMISHKNSLLALADRLILLDQGKLVLDGKKEDVIKQLNSPKAKSAS